MMPMATMPTIADAMIANMANPFYAALSCIR